MVIDLGRNENADLGCSVVGSVYLPISDFADLGFSPGLEGCTHQEIIMRNEYQRSESKVGHE